MSFLENGLGHRLGTGCSNRFRSNLVLAIAFSVAPITGRPAAKQQPPTRSIAIVGTTLIDGAGDQARPDVTIVIEGRVFRRVGLTRSVRVPPGALVIDGRGTFVIPGLWDMHVHLAASLVSGVGHDAMLSENATTSFPPR